MRNTYSPKLITQCCMDYKSGKSVQELIQQYHVPRSTIYFWIKKYKDLPNENQETFITFKRNYLKIKNNETKLNHICEILQKVDCTVSAPLKVKLYELEKLYGQYTVQELCNALKVSTGTFYNHIFRNKKGNTTYAENKLKLCNIIRAIYDEYHGIYGSKKIFSILQSRNYRTSLKTVKRLMHEMQLKSIRSGVKKEFMKEQRPKKNLLQNDFTATAPNQRWVGDITQFHFAEHRVYICAIIDLYSRKVIAYKIAPRATTQLVTSTFKMAYNARQPQTLIFHSDRGSQYTSYAYQKLLHSLDITQSFSRARAPSDNSVIESFFASLKKEELYRVIYSSLKVFKQRVDQYIEFYNERRPHSTLNYISPNEKERRYQVQYSM